MHHKILFFFFVTLLSAAANGDVCGEMFRPAPALEEILSRPYVGIFGRAPGLNAPGPSETRILRAVKKDVLGISGLSARTQYRLMRTFDLLDIERAKHDDALVELHRRRYSQAAESLGFRVRRDFLARLRANREYLSLAFSVAVNGAVNYLSYDTFGVAGILVHIPEFHLFHARQLPDEVLRELLEVKPTDEVPKTREYVASSVRYGIDELVTAGRRVFNIAVLSLVLAAYSDHATDPGRMTERAIDVHASNLRALENEQNRQTLQLIEAKRREFLIAGDMDKVAKADQLIIEIERSIAEPPLAENPVAERAPVANAP